MPHELAEETPLADRTGATESAGPAADSRTAASPNALRTGVEMPVPRHLALQLLDVARQLPDRPVELTLEPAELGRVRMTLSAGETTMNVSLSFERPETADMMRRHIDLLAEEFRQLGYRDVTFDFGGHPGDGRSGYADPEAAGAQLQGEGEAQIDEDVAPARIRLSDRMDIRL